LTALAAACAFFPQCANGAEAFVTRHKCADLKGRTLWEASVTITASNTAPGVYRLVEEGRGNYSGFKGEVIRRSELEYIDGKDGVIPRKMNGRVVSAAGESLLETSQEYDAANGTVKCRAKHFPGARSRDAQYCYKGEVINRLLTGLCINKMLAAGQERRTVYLVSEEPALYRVTMRKEGKEKINVNGREREAIKVCIDPNIGLLSPAKVFITKNYSWFSARPPYEWLRFRGLEDSISSPVVEITTLDN